MPFLPGLSDNVETLNCSKTDRYFFKSISENSAQPRFAASEAGLKFRPVGNISIKLGSLMIQPTQMATQGSSRNSKDLRSLSLILVRFFINKTDVPFYWKG